MSTDPHMVWLYCESAHHRTTLSGRIFATKARIEYNLRPCNIKHPVSTAKISLCCAYYFTNILKYFNKHNQYVLMPREFVERRVRHAALQSAVCFAPAAAG